jgi:hypothetical protein
MPCGHLVCLVVIWYVLWSFGIPIFSFLYVVYCTCRACPKNHHPEERLALSTGVFHSQFYDGELQRHRRKNLRRQEPILRLKYILTYNYNASVVGSKLERSYIGDK